MARFFERFRRSVAATASGLTGSPVTFTADARSATTLSMISGNNQTGTAGTSLVQPFVVQVTDASASPVPGVTVIFAATVGGGSLSATSVTTNTLGYATTLLTLGGIAGTNTVTATAGALSGSPLTFTATGIKTSRIQVTSQ